MVVGISLIWHGKSKNGGEPMTHWSATLDGIRVISLKNSKRVVRTGGRTIVLPSKAHEKFMALALPQLIPIRPRVPFDFPYTLHLTFHLKGKLDSDVDNLCVTVGDLLMAAGIVADDKQCMRLVAEKRSGGKDFVTEIEVVEREE